MKMNQKIICILSALSLIALLSSCGGADSTQESQTTPPSASGSSSTEPDAPAVEDAESSAYVFQTGDMALSIDEDMAGVLAALGEPQSYFEAASCAFDGLDKTYSYSGFVITTRPEGDGDLINSILLTDDSVTTPEGIYIGCTADDVIAAYGDCTETEGVLSYTKGNSALNFVLKDNAVVSIEYLPA